MPGSPFPVLGSDAVTVGVACAVAFLVASFPLALRDRLPDPVVLAIGGGAGYAVLCGAVWAAARAATIGFGHIDASPAMAGWLLLGLLVLAVQAALPLYLYARWRLLSSLAGLFAVTAFVLSLFLRVAGESDPFFLYALFFGPLLIVVLCVVAAGEFGARRLLSVDAT